MSDKGVGSLLIRRAKRTGTLWVSPPGTVSSPPLLFGIIFLFRVALNVYRKKA